MAIVVNRDTCLRTPETLKKLKANKTTDCIFCAETMHEYRYWGLRKNDFPWDTIAIPETHYLLYLIRHSAEPDEDEMRELHQIKKNIKRNNSFEVYAESLDMRASIPDHFHSHVYSLKRKTT